MTDLERAVTMAVGEASMCWNPKPAGVFDSTRALAVSTRLMGLINKEIRPVPPPPIPLPLPDPLWVDRMAAVKVELARVEKSLGPRFGTDNLARLINELENCVLGTKTR